ncbi:hypothetical protein [Humisphaera borealis]|uniref:Uncharacterized protein n=1 Tax=Humisphaera borealis TaxID=2807512 RepID=A0A7M2WR47_9BACT|nr:hypothetical protein [Humisphaera borealis]QOV87622.1 hypothetical protein IPV69_15145 [Humisphaera borealis]
MKERKKIPKQKVSTSRKGDPQAASRGASVARARAELGDAIDRRLNLDIEAMELALLARAIGVSTSQMRASEDCQPGGARSVDASGRAAGEGGRVSLKLSQKLRRRRGGSRARSPLVVVSEPDPLRWDDA